jgi:transmembrane sensor
MDKNRLEYLFDHYFAKTGSEAERHELLDYLQSGEADGHDLEIHRLVTRAFSRAATSPSLAPEAAQRILTAILEGAAVSVESGTEPGASGPLAAPIRRLRWVRRLSAAAVLILIVGGYLWWNHKNVTQSSRIVAPVADISPGRNAAILTLSGGRQIRLDSAVRDTVLTEGAAIVANSQGHLAYNPGNAPTAEAVYNTLTTARGNQYQLLLPDGTRVWLNASSSITYPTSFTGPTRTVSITGEAYFEVAQNASRPFHVTAAGEDIAVLGTSFNMNTYLDEPSSRSTLVEGSIRVTVGGVSRVLRPGEQARVSGGGIVLVPDADLEQALAWKNGYFHFSNSSLQEVMRQLARWYDVEIEYKGEIPDRQFGGEISRNSNASEVLKILELSKIHFRIEGKKIIVMP